MELSCSWKAAKVLSTHPDIPLNEKGYELSQSFGIIYVDRRLTIQSNPLSLESGHSS